LGAFGFGNGQDGLYPLKGSPALAGTALAEDAFGGLLLPGPGKPRSVDLWPLFHTGVPNMRPYQLAVNKGDNPLERGKPFIHNFLPNGGDMLRLNMAVPATDRSSKDFSRLGLIQAAALGGTDSRFNGSRTLQFIPNMDGFPNGRRLEDDVTLIEMQAVSGIVLASIGLYYDDYVPGSGDVLTDRTFAVYNYKTGINKNDTSLMKEFPFVQAPYPGNGSKVCNCADQDQSGTDLSLNRARRVNTEQLNLKAPEMMLTTQNPVEGVNTIRYRVSEPSQVSIVVYDALGTPLKVLVNAKQDAGTYTVQWNTAGISKGTYLISGSRNGSTAQTLKVVKQ
jgi:hypothetical protein